VAIGRCRVYNRLNTNMFMPILLPVRQFLEIRPMPDAPEAALWISSAPEWPRAR